MASYSCNKDDILSSTEKTNVFTEVDKMRKMGKKIVGLLLAASMVLGVAACGKKEKNNSDTPSGGNTPASSNSDVQVGIVLPTKDEPRWLQDQKQFETILGDAGFTNQVLFSQGSSATEKTNVETLISKGIKVLIICAQDGAAASAAVEQAKKSGVKVIAYDRLITGTDAVDYYVTFDSFAVGAAQGQYLIDNAPAGKKGVPLYLYAGAATDNNAFIFFEGAWSVLQPKIADGTFVIANSSEAEALKDKASLERAEVGKIIGQITTDWDFNVAKYVFATDKDIKSYVVTGQDSEKASVQYIIDGKQSMTVFKDTRTLAADSVAMAVSILEGKDPATDTTYNNEKIDVPAKQTSIVVVTKDNVKQALIDSGYYEAADFSGIE